jgi:uncharacterized protein (TIGR02271 family)
MTMHADQLIGTSVIGSDGRALGAVTAVFHDDTDGTPRWVRIQAGKSLPFVPLAGSNMTGRGLQVPFDSQKIVKEPSLNIDKHMSPAQEEQLRRYFDLGAMGQSQRKQSGPAAEAGGVLASNQDWIDLAEERLAVSTEVVESGRARLHRYVETKPVEQTVQVSHEEYEIEHMPVAPTSADHPMTDTEQEIILHEEHAVINKETVPVDRVRLSAKKVTENEVIRDEVRKERIEVMDASAPAPRTGYAPDAANRRR